MTAALPDWNTALRPTEVLDTNTVKRIVLPLDGSDASTTAVPLAQRLSELYGAKLHVAFVGEGRLDLKSAAARLGLTPEQAANAIFEDAAGNPTELVARLTHGSPEALLVVSTALGSQERGNRFGSFTESVFAAKPQRAVLSSSAQAPSRWNPRRILLAHDGTPVSSPAVSAAADLAKRALAEVIALHVAARGEDRPEARGSIAAPMYVDQPQHEWPGWAEEFMNRVAAGSALRSGVHFKLKVTGGQAGSEVADVAREQNVDLVIMAWHGHWAEHEDCATRVVVRNAGCPVMLVYSARRGA